MIIVEFYRLINRRSVSDSHHVFLYQVYDREKLPSSYRCTSNSAADAAEGTNPNVAAALRPGAAVIMRLTFFYFFFIFNITCINKYYIYFIYIYMYIYRHKCVSTIISSGLKLASPIYSYVWYLK